MKITDDLLLRRGFERKESQYGFYYVLGNFGIAKSIKWQPCNVETGEPLSMLLYVENMEELEKMMKETS